jgi:nitrous oxide reductase accessory protein NosL
MRKFSFLLILLLAIIGCEKKEIGAVEKMHWDRDMCERCKMAISERKFAFEIIDPKSGKAYKFDDIGCGILWLDEEKIPWAKSAIMWVTDAKTGEWIDAKKAYYTDDSITPMAYGFAAYSQKTKPKNKKLYDFNYVKKMIFEIEKLNSSKVEAQK